VGFPQRCCRLFAACDWLAGADAFRGEGIESLEKVMEMSLFIEFAGAAILIAGYWRVVLGWLPEADRDVVVFEACVLRRKS
jgi:hypothetical protein